MSPVDEKKRILREFKKLGVQLDRLEELKEAQRPLVIEGDAAGLTAVEMARARCPDKESRYIAEFFRQILRENRKAPPQTPKKKLT